jgi:hypothetical protein
MRCVSPHAFQRISVTRFCRTQEGETNHDITSQNHPFSLIFPSYRSMTIGDSRRVTERVATMKTTLFFSLRSTLKEITITNFHHN